MEPISHHFDNILTNYYPQKHWWRETLIKFLPACKVPKGVIELENKRRQTSTITKTWRERPYACFNTANQRMAQANCRLKVSHHRDRPKFSSEAITTINYYGPIVRTTSTPVFTYA